VPAALEFWTGAGLVGVAAGGAEPAPVGFAGATLGAAAGGDGLLTGTTFGTDTAGVDVAGVSGGLGSEPSGPASAEAGEKSSGTNNAPATSNPRRSFDCRCESPD
jgi:hypothetical protein